MNIAFDATAILAPASKNRGIGNYALSQFKTLLSMDEANKYFCINYFSESVFGDETECFDNLTEYKCWGGKDGALFTNRRYMELFRDLIRRFIQVNRIDVFYITSPFDRNIFPYQREWFNDVNVAVTVYDIIPYVMKETYLADANTRTVYMENIERLKQFDKFLVISNSVKDDLINHLGIESAKIAVIHGAAADIYKKITVSDQEKTTMRNKFNITNDFILCTGGDDFRKNIKGVITAYSKMPNELIQAYQLVIVCKLLPASEIVYADLIAKRRLEGRVILTNFVPDLELLILYNMASLMAFPSKYEGFGLPIVEAFACGVPVLTSNNSSLAEVAEGAAILVDPYSVNDIAKGMAFALTKADTERHIKNGFEKLNFYSWDNVATLTLNAINTLERSPAHSLRRKIACFLSHSEDTAALLDNLSRVFDVDVFTEDGYSQYVFENNKARYFNVVALGNPPIPANGVKKFIVHADDVKEALLREDIGRRVLVIQSLGETAADLICNFVMNTYEPALTEELLQYIIKFELTAKMYTPDEIKRLSEALADTLR